MKKTKKPHFYDRNKRKARLKRLAYRNLMIAIFRMTGNPEALEGLVK